jgi:hypothetical protein
MLIYILFFYLKIFIDVAILNKQKYHFFPYTKSLKRRAEQVMSVGVGTGGNGKHMYIDEKMVTVETIPGMGGGAI